jgi:MFS transporter, YNFM family, putative membrane transport protein
MALAPSVGFSFAAIVVSGVSFYMLHNTLQTNGTQMAPEARGSGLALFALCLFVGQAVGVPVAAPIVDQHGAPTVFWAAAIFLPLLAFWFAHALRYRGS